MKRMIEGAQEALAVAKGGSRSENCYRAMIRKAAES